MIGPAPGATAQWIARTDPAGLLYGAIISAAVLGTVSFHDDDATRVAITSMGFLLVYWMADVYIHAISVRFDRDMHGLGHRLRVSAGHKASVLKGGVPGIVVYLLAYIWGDDSSDAAFIALWFSVALLTAIGYVGARRAGTTGRAAIVEALLAGLLGVLIIAAKSLLH